MTSTTKTAATTKAPGNVKPRMLVVDAERGAGRIYTDLCAARLDCELVTVKSVAEAKKYLATESVTLLVTDLKLPDGAGLSLVPALRKTSPHAGVIVTGKGASLTDAIDAIRGGANDFVAKPFVQDQLAERLANALTRQDQLARNDRKIARLREAVRRLSEARRLVAKKVDLLCNDLVGAYGELSRQVDAVRTTEDFRKLCDKSKDLEQLLCHVMDWIMRRVGYANIAVYLASAESDSGNGSFQLGAYVKYTMPSSPELTDSMRDGLVCRAGKEGFVRMTADESARELTAAELRHLRGQALVAANCTYLGESLATIVLFRDGASPFTNEDAETFRAIAPIFAIALAGQVKSPEDNLGDDITDDSSGLESSEDNESPKKPREERSDADWWKRGEAPPF